MSLSSPKVLAVLFLTTLRPVVLESGSCAAGLGARQGSEPSPAPRARALPCSRFGGGRACPRRTPSSDNPWLSAITAENTGATPKEASPAARAVGPTASRSPRSREEPSLRVCVCVRVSFHPCASVYLPVHPPSLCVLQITRTDVLSISTHY